MHQEHGELHAELISSCSSDEETQHWQKSRKDWKIERKRNNSMAVEPDAEYREYESTSRGSKTRTLRTDFRFFYLAWCLTIQDYFCFPATNVLHFAEKNNVTKSCRQFKNLSVNSSPKFTSRMWFHAKKQQQLHNPSTYLQEEKRTQNRIIKMKKHGKDTYQWFSSTRNRTEMRMREREGGAALWGRSPSLLPLVAVRRAMYAGSTCSGGVLSHLG